MDKKISELTAAGALAGNELLPLVQGGVTKRSTPSATLTYILASIDTDNITEGAVNFFYTEARFDASFAGKDTDDLSEGVVNFYYTEARFDSSFAGKDTGDLAEGLNLYFTNSRADDRITLQKGAANGLATLDAGSKIPSSQIPALAISDTYVVASEVAQLAAGAEIGDVVIRTDEEKTYIHNGGVAGTMADFTELLSPPSPVLSVNGQTGNVSLDTDDITEGAVNFYYTEARFDASFAGKDTDDLSEGAVNFYYTEARFDASFAGKDTDDLTEGATNKYATGDEVQSDPTGVTGADQITNMMSLTQAEYDDITPDASTLYVIVG